MDDEELFGYLDAAPKQDEKDTGAYHGS